MSNVAAEDNAAAELSQSVPTQPPGTWKVTGDLVTARYLHTATLLPNGQVLVAGGSHGSGVLEAAELYDPAIGMWTLTDPMLTRRSGHTTTLLSNGQVLVAGATKMGMAELYDPATGMWTATQRFAPERYYHRATSGPNGQVLVSGGFSRHFGVLARAQLYKSAP